MVFILIERTIEQLIDSYFYIQKDLIQKYSWDSFKNSLNVIHHPKNNIRLKNRDYDIMMNYVGKDETSLNYLKYVYGLEFDEKPRYSYLSNLFVE